MNTEEFVVFTYNIDDKNTLTGEFSSFKTIDEVKLALRNGNDYYVKPYNLLIQRILKKTPGECQSPIILKQQSINLIVGSDKYKPVNKCDIVVDDSLNQIWPKKTGKMPTALTQLLSKTKENIK